MKKVSFLPLFVLLAFCIQAQNYDNVKNMLILQQYKKAKEDLDKAWSNTKYTSKPEAYILKATVCSGLANDAAMKGTAAGDQLMADADASFAKYREMDPSMALLSDPVYQNGPINIYSALFSAGYKDYEAASKEKDKAIAVKSWQSGFEKFKKVVDYSDLLIAKKIIQIPADTNSLLLAGITAENAGLRDEAVKYYGRMADLRAQGAGFEGIYRYMVNYYAVKKDMVNFEKYKAIGKELYPDSEFFTYDKVDFAVGLEEDFSKKIIALEEVIAADPSNVKATMLLGELLYDTLNSHKEDAVYPSNAAELEAKMVKAFTKVAELKPDDELPWIYIADSYINKSLKVNEARDKHAADMKARTQPGKPNSKEDVAKRDALDAEYGAALDKAAEPYEKAAAIFAKKEKLTGQQKQQYKKVVGYLGDIYMNKKIRANKEKKTADATKYAGEEKKWNDRYETIK